MKSKIYLLPGIMCDERLWKNIKPYLKNNYELVHLDISNKENLDELCQKILSEIKEEKINLLGFSLGAYIASYFAVKYKHRVSKLMLLGNSACDLPEFEIQKRENIIKHINNFGFKGLAKKKVQSLLDKQNQNNEELILLIQEMYKNLGKEVFISQLSSTLRRKDLKDDLSTLDIPVSFVYSKEDILVNIEWINELKSKNSRILFNEFLGSSHMLPLEKPKEVSKMIEEFF